MFHCVVHTVPLKHATAASTKTQHPYCPLYKEMGHAAGAQRGKCIKEWQTCQWLDQWLPAEKEPMFVHETYRVLIDEAF